MIEATGRRGAALAAALLMAGCMPQSPEVSGRALYAENCAVCHGPAGRGDGPAAGGMTPAPTDLTRLSAAAGGEFPLVQVMSQIDGYTRGAAGDPMPDFGALLDGPLVPVDTGDGVFTPTPAPLHALALHLETLQR